MEELNELIKIEDYTKPKYDFMIGELHDNRALVKIKADSTFSRYLYGYIDSDGNEVISCKYTYAGRFNEGLAYVRQNEHEYIIDTNENIVLNLDNYEVPGGIDDYFSNGLLEVRNAKGKCGYINKKGEEVIPCIYDLACCFSEGLALVFNKVPGEGHYIDINGNTQLFSTTEYGFNALDSKFSNGIAHVISRTTGETMYINKEGKIVEIDIEKSNELYRLESEKTTIKKSVEEQLVIYCSNINIGGKNFSFNAFTKEELSNIKLNFLSLIEARIKLEKERILETEKSIDSNSIEDNGKIELSNCEKTKENSKDIIGNNFIQIIYDGKLYNIPLDQHIMLCIKQQNDIEIISENGCIVRDGKNNEETFRINNALRKTYLNRLLNLNINDEIKEYLKRYDIDMEYNENASIISIKTMVNELAYIYYLEYTNEYNNMDLVSEELNTVRLDKGLDKTLIKKIR